MIELLNDPVIVAAATSVVTVLGLKFLKFLKELVLRTPTKIDDELVEAIIKAIEKR